MALGNIRIIMTSAFTKMFDSEGVVPNDVRPLRQTTHGSIQGYFMESDGTLAEVYEAVPYAEPPTGLLRFEKTKELKSWNGTRDCGRNHMIQCVQFGDDFSGTEDCLYATIVLPHNDMKTGRRYPILIWLHGGSFQTGSANIIPIEAMVKNFASNDIVLISINYRLGPLGFLTASHRDLHGNYGLDDQIKAIEWIRANARNFDADPNNIIVGGMGAGAACASILAISPKTKGLFNGVILRSGSVLAPWAVQSVSTEDYSAQLIDYCGCSYNQTLGMAHTVECLKNVPIIKLQNGWRQIVKLTSTITGNGNFILGSTYFTPVSDPFRIEASILPGDPENVLIHNSRMPILIGVTNQEAAQWMSEFPVSSGRYLENGDWDLSHVIPPFFYANYKQVLFQKYFLTYKRSCSIFHIH
ncbi:unnamed protein product [Thelazia callipaeda]|uniref:COesterase domain-containing protein n=1 Tax=Thelazia callipaeda TaxID=103827 RepID=A0A0N5CSE5_THECL|nr:unnamed protein product [Thelazia callipaeda]